MILVNIGYIESDHISSYVPYGINNQQESSKSSPVRKFTR